jgi:hypothetical protein
LFFYYHLSLSSPMAIASSSFLEIIDALCKNLFNIEPVLEM